MVKSSDFLQQPSSRLLISEIERSSSAEVSLGAELGTEEVVEEGKAEKVVEVKAEIFQQLADLNSWLGLQSATPISGQRGFYQLLSHHLSWFFEHRKWLPLIKPTALPPGSPI